MGELSCSESHSCHRRSSPVSPLSLILRVPPSGHNPERAESAARCCMPGTRARRCARSIPPLLGVPFKTSLNSRPSFWDWVCLRFR